MFQENKKHGQPNLFNPEYKMNNTRKLVLKNNWSEKFYEKVFRGIKEKPFESLYCNNNGRPNFPVNILVGLEIIKEMFALTDEQLYENYHFNYLYQKAVGVENIDENSFSIRTLYNFRCALAEYERDNDKDLYLELFKEGRDQIIRELEIKTGLQRTDSVMIGANIKRMSRFTLFHKVLSNLVGELLKQGESVSSELKELVSEEEDSVYYRLTKSEVEVRLKELANFLFIHTERWRNDKRINETKAYLDAERLISEQCRVVSKTKVELKLPEEIVSGSLQNPADSDATYRFKKEERHYGYAAHGTETCDPENPVQIITGIETVKNNVDDAEVLSESIPVLKEETKLETIIADGGYVSDAVRNVSKEEEVNFIATAIRGKSQDEDVLDSLSFPLKENGLIEKCPNGEIPIKQRLEKDGNLIANFDVKKCVACPLKERCIAFKSDKQSRLVIDTKRRWLDERRASMGTEEHLKLSRMRPAVEGLMDKLKPKYLRGRTLFRGLGKVRNRMTLRVIGLNFRRYFAWFLDILDFFIVLIENQLQLTQKHHFSTF